MINLFTSKNNNQIQWQCAQQWIFTDIQVVTFIYRVAFHRLALDRRGNILVALQGYTQSILQKKITFHSQRSCLVTFSYLQPQKNGHTNHIQMQIHIPYTNTKILDMIEHKDTKILDMCEYTETKFLDRYRHLGIIIQIPIKFN